MLDKNDKQWITETIDEKLNETTAELRGEMQEMKTELRDEMQEMRGEIITDMTALFENSYEEYVKLFAEILPEKVRSYDAVEEVQFQQQGDINTLKSIAVDHGDRIAKLEKALV